MALMDTPMIDPLARALSSLLKSSGRFVFSVTHPRLNRADMSRVARWSDEGGIVRETVGLEIHRYLTPRPVQGLGMIRQPLAQTYFERSLSLLLGSFFKVRWVVDALEEPAFPEAFDSPPPSPQPGFSWPKSLREIPSALVVRMSWRGPGWVPRTRFGGFGPVPSSRGTAPPH